MMYFTICRHTNGIEFNLSNARAVTASLWQGICCQMVLMVMLLVHKNTRWQHLYPGVGGDTFSIFIHSVWSDLNP